MKKLFIIALAIALFTLGVLGTVAAALAGPIANWGGTFCKLEPAMQQQHIAKVTCSNILTGGETENRAVLSIGGLAVGITATMGPGRSTDKFELTLLDGLIAVPPMIDLQEGASGSMLIFALGSMLVG